MGLAEDRETLRQLGFDDARAEQALKATNSGGLDAALDWLENHGNVTPPQSESVDNTTVEAMPASSALSKGLKCADCDKFFKNQALASYHSDKSGHVNFEEVEFEDKPLTEEEKKERLERLRQQLEAKRLAKAKVEAEEAKANEYIRRKGGKDMQKIKDDLKKKELEKEIAQKKKDKEAEAKAKARVRQEIENDKKERARKAALEKAKRLGLPPPSTDEPLSAAAEKSAEKLSGKPTAQSGTSKEYTEGKFQLRLPNPGAAVIVLTLKVDQTLLDLANRLFEHPTFTDQAIVRKENLQFSTTYPRKVFTAQEMSKTIKELGLVPSVALAVSYG